MADISRGMFWIDSSWIRFRFISSIHFLLTIKSFSDMAPCLADIELAYFHYRIFHLLHSSNHKFSPYIYSKYSCFLINFDAIWNFVTWTISDSVDTLLAFSTCVHVLMRNHIDSLVNWTIISKYVHLSDSRRCMVKVWNMPTENWDTRLPHICSAKMWVLLGVF